MNIPTFFKKYIVAVAFFVIAPAGLLLAQDAAATVPATSPYMILRYLLLGVCALLAIIIGILAFSVNNSLHIYKARKQEQKKGKETTKTVSLTIAALMFFSGLWAQDAATVTSTPNISQPVLPWDIYFLLAAIILEFIVIVFLIGVMMYLLGVKIKRKNTRLLPDGRIIKVKSFFTRINNTVAIEDEAALDLNHDYDGIRELDNKIPGWWQIAFYGTIIFGVIYIFRMFVSETLPTQLQELQAANEKAAIAKAAYLKNAANNVDENTVTLADEAGIAAGKALFGANCIACHGDMGQGNAVGPNLTDDYWIHKGGLRDIFYTIKYGWPEKGMKSWKEDFSPVQIAQLASYVKGLHGTNPPGAKGKEGELYTDSGNNTPADSTAVKDSSSTVK